MLALQSNSSIKLPAHAHAQVSHARRTAIVQRLVNVASHEELRLFDIAQLYGHRRPQEFFQRGGGKTAQTDKYDQLFGAPQARTKIFVIFSAL